MVLVRDTDLISIETFLKIAPEDTNPVWTSFNYPMTVGILLKPRSLLLGEQNAAGPSETSMVLNSSIIRENQLVNSE